MTITVRKVSPSEYPLCAEDMQEGHVYITKVGTIFICNPFQNVIAFSLCGTAVVTKGCSTGVRFLEVNLDASVYNI